MSIQDTIKEHGMPCRGCQKVNEELMPNTTVEMALMNVKCTDGINLDDKSFSVYGEPSHTASGEVLCPRWIKDENYW